MEKLLLLHGALGSKSQFSELEIQLSGKYKTYSMNFSGHGGSDFADEPFSIPFFAKETLDFISSMDLMIDERINIFGYSMGGYVAMYLARFHPEKIRTVCTLATKYHWDSEVAGKESNMLILEKIETKLPEFAKTLEARHLPGDWKKVVKMTRDMLVGLGENNAIQPGDYEGIMLPVLLMSGDKDKMVSLEETVGAFRKIPGANLAILPGTPHPFEQANIKTLCYFIDDFLRKV